MSHPDATPADEDAHVAEIAHDDARVPETADDDARLAKTADDDAPVAETWAQVPGTRSQEPAPAVEAGGAGPGLAAQASGAARIYQAQRDLHVAQRDLHVHYAGIFGMGRLVAGGDPGVCPYPGLAAFGTDQAAWFFGRDALTADVLVRLDARLPEGGALMVVAPSGAGKSSLLKAGVLAAVARGALPGSAAWPRALLTPTDRPLAALAAGLARGGGDAERWAAAVAAGPAACVAAMRAFLCTGGVEEQARGRWVLVVDQLEELFTQCADDQERRAFLDLLQAVAAPGEDGQSPVGLLVYGLRSDFCTPCADHRHLREALQDGPVVVGPMSEEEIRQAIVFPARDVGLELEPGLVETLLRDLAGPPGTGARDPRADSARQGRYETGRLPLLAHALRATWQQRAGHILTVEGYERTSGIAHAVATTADREFARLDPSGQVAARAVLLALVHIGRDAEDTRRRVPHGELLACNSDPATAALVVEAFTRARLLAREQDDVQISHEVLLRAWPRLRQWIDVDRSGNLLRQELEEAAADWERAHRDTSLLYRGSRLDAASTWADAAQRENVSGAASAFLTAGVRQRRRSARLRRTVIGVLAALTLVASATPTVVLRQRAAAERQTRTAHVSQLQIEADELRATQPSLAAQLDVAAYRMEPSGDLRDHLVADSNSPLSTTLRGHARTILTMAFSPDGRTLASGGEDHTVRLWVTGAHGGRARYRALPSFPSGFTDWVTWVAFSPHGHTLAAGSQDGTVRLWDVTDPARPARLGPVLTGRGGVGSVAFSPDGRTFAVGREDGSVRLWDMTDPAHATPLGVPLTGFTDWIDSLAFSPDGHTLAAGREDGTVRLWDVGDPARAEPLGVTLTGFTEAITSVAFRPVGHTLAAGSDNGVRLWDVTDPARAKALGVPLTGHTKWMASVAFSPDGRTLAAGSEDGVHLWDVTDPADVAALGTPLTGPIGAVYAVAFSPDGHSLAAGSKDRTIRVWDPAALLGTPLTGHKDAVGAVAFSPDGRTLVTASKDRTVRLWDVTDPARARPLGVPLTGFRGPVGAAVFAPGGHVLATGGSDGAVRLWDVTDPAHARLLGSPLTGHRAFVTSVAFSPDGRTLATASDDRTVRLWDVTHPRQARPLGAPLTGHTDDILTVAFSPDGHALASGGRDDTVRLWDVTDANRATPLGAPLIGHINWVNSVAFSPDGHTLASADGDSVIRLWDVTDPANPTGLTPLTGHTNAIDSVAFSPDGRTLLSGGSDRTLRLWDVTEPANATPLGPALIGHTGTVLAVAFSPDGHTVASADEDRTVRLRDSGMDADHAIRRICAGTDPPTRGQWEQYAPRLHLAPPCG